MKKIFLTVDTECHHIDKENQFIWGVKGERKFGIEKIIEIANEFRIPINFFVDIAEAKRYGDEFVERIIRIIEENGHKVYLHLHPNYLTGDDTKTFLWQYSYTEQKEILKYGFNEFFRLTKKKNCAAFRIGRYGASEQMYMALNELGISTIDLSYCCFLPKMCKLNFEQIGVYNIPKIYYNQIILPNTRYVGFDYLGLKKIFNLDVSECNFAEFKDFINNSSQQNVVLTMHSWDLIKRFFFFKHIIFGGKTTIRKFRKMILTAERSGYTFSDLEADFKFEEGKERDILINPVKLNFYNKLSYLYYNFIRFQKIASISRKYFILFAIFYFVLIIAITSLYFNF